MAVTLAEAERAIAASVVKAQALGIRVSVAVVDPNGSLVALHRMDGAGPITVDIAQNMAYTSATFRMPGASMADWYMQPWFHSMVLQSHGKLLPADGGLPMRREKEVLGAIGVSGGSGAQDKECSEAGIATLAT